MVLNRMIVIKFLKYLKKKHVRDNILDFVAQINSVDSKAGFFFFFCLFVKIFVYFISNMT